MKHKKTRLCGNEGADKCVPNKIVRESRRKETKIELAAGEPDLEALRSVTREWLVPLLVEKFLREQGIGSRVRSENTNCQFIGREGGAGTARNAGGASSSTLRRARQKRPLLNVSEPEKQLPSDR